MYRKSLTIDHSIYCFFLQTVDQNLYSNVDFTARHVRVLAGPTTSRRDYYLEIHGCVNGNPPWENIHSLRQSVALNNNQHPTDRVMTYVLKPAMGIDP